MKAIPCPSPAGVSARLVCGALTLTSHALFAQEVTRAVSDFLPTKSNCREGVLERWCNRIARNSNGKLKYPIHPAMQFGGTPPQRADPVKNALVDIVMTSPSYSSGRFPHAERLEQPFTLPPGGLSGRKAMREFNQRYAAKACAEVKLLAVFIGSGVVMSAAGKPILNVDGFKGDKPRSRSRSAARLLTALCGAPVNMPPAQFTEAVAKCVVDARRLANDAGHKTLTVKPEDHDAMRKDSALVEVEWAKKVAPKGLGGAMLVKEARATGAQFVK
jgi:TRAP-type transport system periplasmic protein